MLVAASVDTLAVVVSSVGTFITTINAVIWVNTHGVADISCLTEAQIRAAQEELEEFVDNIKIAARVWATFAVGVLTLTIASVEMIIKYNDLRPETSLSAPGQIIPLAIGIIVLFDGIFSVAVALRKE